MQPPYCAVRNVSRGARVYFAFAMSGKKRGKPAWWKSSYFWITGILLVIAVYGFAMGPSTIADTGQSNSGPLSPDNSRDVAADIRLPLLYLGAALLMAFNGIISHRQYVAQYHAEQEQEQEKI